MEVEELGDGLQLDNFFFFIEILREAASRHLLASARASRETNPTSRCLRLKQKSMNSSIVTGSIIASTVATLGRSERRRSIRS